MPLYVQESWVNRSEGYGCGESDVYETWTDDRGELYRDMQREYGRCEGKVYVDTPDGAKAVGWVFVKRAKYTDCDETYLQETWVTVHAAPPVRKVEYAYA